MYLHQVNFSRRRMSTGSAMINYWFGRIEYGSSCSAEHSLYFQANGYIKQIWSYKHLRFGIVHPDSHAHPYKTIERLDQSCRYQYKQRRLATTTILYRKKKKNITITKLLTSIQ